MKLMDNIIFHTQYIKMEIRFLHKGVTQSFHYRALFYLFHHKNALFRIQFTFLIWYKERGVDTIEDWKGSIFLKCYLFKHWHLKQDHNQILNTQFVCVLLSIDQCIISMIEALSSIRTYNDHITSGFTERRG